MGEEGGDPAVLGLVHNEKGGLRGGPLNFYIILRGLYSPGAVERYLSISC